MMLEFCKNTIKDIEFIYVQKDQLKETREFLDSRFENLQCQVQELSMSFHPLVNVRLQ